METPSASAFEYVTIVPEVRTVVKPSSVYDMSTLAMFLANQPKLKLLGFRVPTKEDSFITRGFLIYWAFDKHEPPNTPRLIVETRPNEPHPQLHLIA